MPQSLSKSWRGDSSGVSGCEMCDSEEGHPTYDRLILIDGKTFCIDSRRILTNADGEFDVEGEWEMSEAEIEALNEERIEPVGKDKKDLPMYPWNPKSWRIVKPEAASGQQGAGSK